MLISPPRLKGLSLLVLPFVLGLGIGALLIIEPASPLQDGLPVMSSRPLIDEGDALRPIRQALRGARAAGAALSREARLVTRGEVRRSWSHETNSVTLQITSVLTPELRTATLALGGTYVGSLLPIEDDAVAVITRDGEVLIFDVSTLQIRTKLRIPEVVASQNAATGLRDVAVLTRTPSTLTLVASYGWTEAAPRNCLRAGLVSVTLDLEAIAASAPRRLWATDECVPLSRAYGATLGGRVLVTPEQLFLTLGDVGAAHPEGSVFDTLLAFPIGPEGEVTPAPEIVSRGFRNPAGLTDAGGAIYVAAQGPKGGDTILLSTPGAHFGWPQVSYGEEYAFSGFPPPHTSGPSVTLPQYVWVPSPAISALDVNRTSRFDRWFNEEGVGDLLATSLKGRALHRCRLGGEAQVVYCETVVIGERLRDVVSTPATLILLADDGYVYQLVPQ